MPFKPYHLRNYVRGAEAAARARRQIELRGTTFNGHPIWTDEEIEICRRLYPDYRATKRKLRRRSLVAIQHKCNELGLVPARPPWTGQDLARLRRLYPSASWEELFAAFPGRTKLAITRAANSYGYVREKKRYLPTGHAALDQVRQRCFEEGYVMRDIDQYAKSKGYFQSLWPNAPKTKIHHRAIAKAIEALGGTVKIEWEE